jgi:hypothetical protein
LQSFAQSVIEKSQVCGIAEGTVQEKLIYNDGAIWINHSFKEETMAKEPDVNAQIDWIGSKIEKLEQKKRSLKKPDLSEEMKDAFLNQLDFQIDQLRTHKKQLEQQKIER